MLPSFFDIQDKLEMDGSQDKYMNIASKTFLFVFKPDFWLGCGVLKSHHIFSFINFILLKSNVNVFEGTILAKQQNLPANGW